MLIGGFGLIFWQYVPRRGGPNPPPAPAHVPLMWVALPIVAVFIGVVALLAVQWFRNFDPGVRRAEKRASEGDLDGAIAELREQIEEKGSTQIRVNALGILLMRRERWDEAAAMFRKGEQLGESSKGICRANLGLALLKSGKAAEAIPVLQEAARIGPQGPPLNCIINLHLSLALADLNRWEEAEERFRAAEGAARSLRKSQRDVLTEELERCRQKLAQHS
jgi:tetratricopeptide (TPR) repeat protein